MVKRRVRLCALRFLSRPELAGCAQEMADCRAALARAEDAFDDAVDARVAATAEIEYRDAHLGEAVASSPATSKPSSTAAPTTRAAAASSSPTRRPP
ncbi:MAG: hypothetical protein U0324_02185 [Polyangiales bacterium]